MVGKAQTHRNGRPVQYTRFLRYLNDVGECNQEDALRILNYKQKETGYKTLDRLVKNGRIYRIIKNGQTWYRPTVPEIFIPECPEGMYDETHFMFDKDNEGFILAALVTFALHHPRDPGMLEWFEAECHVMNQYMYKPVLREIIRNVMRGRYGIVEYLEIRDKLIKEGWITREEFDSMKDSGLRRASKLL